MQIRRDYSQPFFSTRRRRRTTGRRVLFYAVFIGALLLLVNWQFGRLQLMALDVVGMAPTATPFASDSASRGNELYLSGKLQDAANAFQQAVSQQPDNINYVYEYGRILIELNRPSTANSGFSSIISKLQLSQETRDALNILSVSDIEMANLLGEHALRVAPQDVRSYTLKAKALYWLNDSETAIPIALQGIELNPNFAPLLAVLSLTYTDIDRYQQGLKYGEDAVAADNMNADAHRAYAISLILIGERNAAIRELETAININPNLTAPYFELAGQFLAANRDDEAVATYETILTMDSRNAKAMLRLCEAYTKVGQFSQAEGYCDDAITSNPTDDIAAASYRQLGTVNFRRRNYEDAIKNFGECQKRGSTEIQCFYLLGLSHYYLGQCDQAWTVLKDQALPMAQQPGLETILQTVEDGLKLVTENCSAYQNAALPTLIPPTPVLPTPIGITG